MVQKQLVQVEQMIQIRSAKKAKETATIIMDERTEQMGKQQNLNENNANKYEEKGMIYDQKETEQIDKASQVDSKHKVKWQLFQPNFHGTILISDDDEDEDRAYHEGEESDERMVQETFEEDSKEKLRCYYF